MKKLIPLFAMVLCSHAALAGGDGDIWSYKNADGISLEKTCNDRSTCNLLYKNKHYVAIINNRSETGCSTGDLILVEHKSRSYIKPAPASCSSSASIEVGSYNGLNTIDVVIGDRVLKRYTLDVWSILEDQKEHGRASWSKAEENAKKTKELETPKGPPAQWRELKDGNYHRIEQDGNMLTIQCSYLMPGADWPFHSMIQVVIKHEIARALDDIEVDGKRIPITPKSRAEWENLVKATMSASKIVVYSGNRPKAIWSATPTKQPEQCNYYRG